MGIQVQSEKAERAIHTLELRSVLLVDDDKQLASALQWILADENFLVDVAHDGEEAVLKIKVNDYDVVICDLMMPRMRGDELYTKAQEMRPILSDRFVFITGYPADPKVTDFLTRYRMKYLVKPFPVQALIRSVKELLA
jgi:DNA-binding response OmpR family regulator